MLGLDKTLLFYKKPEVQECLIKLAQNKEIAVRYAESMGKRPDTLTYNNDVMELVKKGALSFHVGEETWKNPLLLKAGMKREEMDSLRIGWDLIIDIDCKIFEYSKIATYYIVKTLQRYKINCTTVKFSGNKGFHIAVPWEAFPETIGSKKTKDLFPEAPQRIAMLIKEAIKKPVTEALLKLEKGNIENISKKLNDPKVIVYENNMGMLNIEPFLAIDTILISSRHLYRMPYSFHEKSGLVSIPIELSHILSFKKEEAEPEKAKFDVLFLDRTQAKKNEARLLLTEAFDFAPQLQEEKKEEKEFLEISTELVPEEYFPPTIKKILEGMEDGRKRGLFVLANFFSCVGWDYERMYARIEEWNKKNKEQLKEVYIKGQLRYYKSGKKKLPPNYDNKAYYSDLGVYMGELENDGSKNPVQWVRKRMKYRKQEKPVKKEVKKEATEKKELKKKEEKENKEKT
jgi:hypothetical protein